MATELKVCQMCFPIFSKLTIRYLLNNCFSRSAQNQAPLSTQTPFFKNLKLLQNKEKCFSMFYCMNSATILCHITLFTNKNVQAVQWLRKQEATAPKVPGVRISGKAWIQTVLPYPHQWLSGSAFKTGRQDGPGSISGRACQPSRSEFSVVFDEPEVKRTRIPQKDSNGRHSSYRLGHS